MSNENKKNFECQICKTELPVSPQQFLKHYQNHSKNFHCNICQKTFPTHAVLEKHMNSAHVTQSKVKSESEKKKYEDLVSQLCRQIIICIGV